MSFNYCKNENVCSNPGIALTGRGDSVAYVSNIPTPEELESGLVGCKQALDYWVMMFKQNKFDYFLLFEIWNVGNSTCVVE